MQHRHLGEAGLKKYHDWLQSDHDFKIWAEVLNIGGYDVLPQPLERDEVQRVVAAARRQFSRPASRGPQSSAPVPSARVA